MTTTRVAPTYTKSTRSTSTGNCVEVADLGGGHRAIRDSKHPTGPVLTCPASAWAAFTASVRAGEFD